MIIFLLALIVAAILFPGFVRFIFFALFCLFVYADMTANHEDAAPVAQLQTPQLQTPQLQTPQLQTPQLQTPQLQTPHCSTSPEITAAIRKCHW